MAFVPLSSNDWKQLESEFSIEKVQYHFLNIDSETRLFNLSFDEVDKIVKERGL